MDVFGMPNPKGRTVPNAEPPNAKSLHGIEGRIDARQTMLTGT
jgi:hypothetical protein